MSLTEPSTRKSQVAGRAQGLKESRCVRHELCSAQLQCFFSVSKTFHAQSHSLHHGKV